MMIIAYKNNTYSKRIPLATRRDIALQAFKKQQTVSDISKTYGCSRTTVYKHQNKALTAVNKAFEDEDDDNHIPIWSKRSELIDRLLAEKCELCESQENIAVHHIRKLADIRRKEREEAEWKKQMRARHRKTLIVCQNAMMLYTMENMMEKVLDV
jgi:transposase-like protein